MYDRVVNMSDVDKKRPGRDAFEDITDRVPSGPLGAVGQGNIIGGLGYIAIESGEIIALPIPGLDRPGFKFVSHGMEQKDEGKQVHTIVIHAISRDVAEFACQYKAAPSNFDYVRGKTNIQKVEVKDGDSFYSTYRMTVVVDRNAIRRSRED